MPSKLRAAAAVTHPHASSVRDIVTWRFCSPHQEWAPEARELFQVSKRSAAVLAHNPARLPREPFARDPRFAAGGATCSLIFADSAIKGRAGRGGLFADVFDPALP